MKYDSKTRTLTMHYANGEFAEAIGAARREFPEAINIVALPESFQDHRFSRRRNISLPCRGIPEPCAWRIVHQSGSHHQKGNNMNRKIETYAGWTIEKKRPGTYIARTDGGRLASFAMWTKKRIRKFLAERAYPPPLGRVDECPDYGTPERAERFYSGLLDERIVNE